ncbi:hypothetical protein [Streptomyces sp. NPDC056144]|uniref:hypothetical protein n=1 Tax=unclassified Streptomyces TaxID=2593676 RepID=UPI0035E22D7F
MRRRVRAATVTAFVLLAGLVLPGCGSGYDKYGYEGYGDPWGQDPKPPRAGHDGLPGRDKQSDKPDEPGFRPDGHLAYQLPIIPISFSISASGKFRVSVTPKLSTPLGTVSFSTGVSSATDEETGKPLPPAPADVTQLFLCEKGQARRHCEGYRIGTGRKLTIEMDGKFVQQVEQQRIVIEAEPGSTIRVLDAGEPTKRDVRGPAYWAIEEYEIKARGKDYSAIDLEQSYSGTKADLAYDHVTGELKTVNGAQVSQVTRHSVFGYRDDVMTGADYPTEDKCLKTPEAEWRPGFTAEDLGEDIVVSCVKTAEGDLGFLAIGPRKWDPSEPVGYRVYALTWVR